MSEPVVIEDEPKVPQGLEGRESAVPSTRRTRPSTAKRLLEVLWLVLGIGVIAGVIYGTAIVLGSTVLSPQAWAERYVALVAQGAFTEASELVDPGTDPAASQLLRDGSLEGGQGIGDVEVTLLEMNGPSARVNVAYELDGTPQEAELSLWRRLSFFGLASEWRVSTPLLGTVRLTTTGPDHLLVGGTEVQVQGEASLPAYPGVYPVALADETYFTLAEPLEAVVSSNGTAEVAVAGVATDALNAAVVEGVNALLDECATSTEIAPPGCPFAVVLYDEYRDLRWRITDYPELTVSADGVTFETEKQGRAYARFQVENFAGRGWVDSSFADRFTVAGTVTVIDGQVEVAFDDGSGGVLSD